MCEGSHARSHEDKPWRAGLAEDGEESICQARGADDIDCESFAEGIACGRPVEKIVSGVVDEHVETPVSRVHLGRCAIDGFVICHVELNGGNGTLDFREPAEGFRSGVSFGYITAAKDDMIVTGGENEVLCCLEAETLVGSYICVKKKGTS